MFLSIYHTGGILFYPNWAVEEVSNYQLLLGHSHIDNVESYLHDSQIRIKKDPPRKRNSESVPLVLIIYCWSRVLMLVSLTVLTSSLNIFEVSDGPMGKTR